MSLEQYIEAGNREYKHSTCSIKLTGKMLDGRHLAEFESDYTYFGLSRIAGRVLIEINAQGAVAGLMTRQAAESAGYEPDPSYGFALLK